VAAKATTEATTSAARGTPVEADHLVAAKATTEATTSVAPRRQGFRIVTKTIEGTADAGLLVDKLMLVAAVVEFVGEAEVEST
jgi:hypothetical protein